jgi:hypothetical protein|tara:strand:- start:203 stop:607 length:405 start_codon:yes stop_codon:yes gene_type:complete
MIAGALFAAKTGRRPALLAPALLLGALFLLAGCSAEPFPTNPPKAMVKALQQRQQEAELLGRAFEETRMVSLCYAPGWGKPGPDQKAATKALLAARCPASGDWQVRFYGQDQLGTNCPLLQNVRLTFICRRPGQ